MTTCSDLATHPIERSPTTLTPPFSAGKVDLCQIPNARNSCALYMLLDFGRPFPLEGVRFGTRAGRDGPLCDDPCLRPFLSSADFEDLTELARLALGCPG